MVTNGQIMDNQRQQYLPGPPPPQNNMPHLPGPPPRPYGQSNVPPPPPGPHPSVLPPGTVYGIPGGWQQSWGRPVMAQGLPPPPPINHSHTYNPAQFNRVQPNSNLPPPPPQQYDKPLLSATFIPGGDSFGPGVGIPPLDDYSSTTYLHYNFNSEPSSAHPERSYSDGVPTQHQFTYPNPAQLPPHDNANRDLRAASASANRLPSMQRRDYADSSSPGLSAATLHNPQVTAAFINDTPLSPSGTRPRAQSAGISPAPDNELASQWPLDQVLLWLAANGFSDDWQETFELLRLGGNDFLELGRGRNGLTKMHQIIFPQLAKVCSNSTTGWDQGREREEGKRLRRLIGKLEQQGEGPSSAGVGHRRRESGFIPSASTEGTVENSPHLGKSEFSSTFTTKIPEDSPEELRHTGVPNGFGPRGSQGRSSTMPVLNKKTSPATTSDEAWTKEQRRMEKTKAVMSGLEAHGFLPASPNSPALTQVTTASTTNSLHPEHSRNTSGTIDVPASTRFYENRRDAQDLSRPHLNDVQRLYSSDSGAPGKEHSKGFLSKIMGRRGKQDTHSSDEQAESPTSPAFPKPTLNGSEISLATRPPTAPAQLEGDKPETLPKRNTRTARRYIFATPDFWNYRLVDVTDIESAVALRSLLCIELGVVDAEYAQIFVTEPGQTDHGEPLTDANLMSIRARFADKLGSMKFYVQSPTTTGSLPKVGAIGVPFVSRPGQPSERGEAMVKSNSAGGMHRDGYPSTNTSSAYSATSMANADALEKAAEEYRRQNKKKQEEYLASRRAGRDGATTSPFVGSGIRGSAVVDFDSPRISPYEEKREGSYVPQRRPPTAPSESNTLTKVNSLRARPGSCTRSSLDALKRLSNPIEEEALDRTGKKAIGSPRGIGAALVNAGRMAGGPGMVGGSSAHARSFSGGSGREPGFSKKLSSNALQRGRTSRYSPAVSPTTASRPPFGTMRSFDSAEFRETNVKFAPVQQPAVEPGDDDSDDGSDDGLFAIPIANKSLPPDGMSDSMSKDQRPALTVNTDQDGRKGRAVSFKSPGSAGGVSLPETRAVKENGTPDGQFTNDRSFSEESAGYSASTQSPDDRMARRGSFASNIWADRPAVERVVDNLDEFFPGVDLDKPYFEEKDEGLLSPSQPSEQASSRNAPSLDSVNFGTSGLNLDFERKKNESDTLGSDESTLKAKDRSSMVSIAQRQLGRSGGLGRMKSIREVAHKRNVTNDLKREPSIAAYVPPVKAGGIVRRKSTKMFGANIVQIRPRPGSRVSVLDPIPDVQVENKPEPQATFKIIRGQLIGKGTYGRVYLAMNATTGDFLAVKQVEVNKKAAGQDKERIKEMVKALDHEIDTMKNFEHPNIVQYLGCEKQEFSMSIYLEYIPGGSIGSCLRKHGKFEESVVRSLTRQTLEGLAYLHQESVLHRDLKADNILLDLDGTCKISDFGISKKSDNIYGNDVTNSMQGSVFWMAPEVVRSEGGYSAKVDIWSLGCVVLEMLAGKRPWSREEAIGAIFKLGKLNQAPPIPDDVQNTASVDGLNFMYDCFQIEPDERPTARTLLDHSSFCIPDPYYNFFETMLAAKLRQSDVAPTGV